MTIGGAGAANPLNAYQKFISADRQTVQKGRLSGNASNGINGEVATGDPDKVRKPGRRSSPEECETCKNRKYQDGSNENVSFKSATHISPEAAAAAVRAHEGEHVTNAYNKASQKGGKVVSASVRIDTGVCPECGRVYVSGGETTTQIKYPNEDNPYQKNAKGYDASSVVGRNMDMAV